MSGKLRKLDEAQREALRAAHAKRREILRSMKTLVQERRRCPTVRELARRFGVSYRVAMVEIHKR